MNSLFQDLGGKGVGGEFIPAKGLSKKAPSGLMNMVALDFLWYQRCPELDSTLSRDPGIPLLQVREHDPQKRTDYFIV